MCIRANLQSGEHQDWVGVSPAWYREIGRDTQSAGTRDSDHKLGITTEQVLIRLRKAFKVTDVESDSLAAKAGLEVEWNSAMRGRNQKRSLVLTTEIAFFGGNPVQKVIDVAEGSPAQLAGIKSGLLILSADGNPLPKPAGRNILCRVQRNSKAWKVGTTPGASVVSALQA